MLDFKRLDKRQVAKALDFSILPKETQEAEIREGCAVTRQYGFAAFYAVCLVLNWWFYLRRGAYVKNP